MFDLESILPYREGNRLEAKDARGGLPRSLWETYSSFANTEGGIILLGVKEVDDHRLVAVGLPHPERLEKAFWDEANNKKIVSANILTNSDVFVELVGEASVLVIDVPRASHEARPVYTKGDVLAGSYRRNGEGDYHCSEDEVKAMLRDSGTGVADRSPLEHIDVTALCDQTVRRYQNELSAVRPGHPWSNLGQDDLLLRLGALARSSRDARLHPTRAGLLMFGYEYEIAREFPYYFLEYREVFSERRWDDRLVTNDGEWSGNVFDFWLKVSLRLTADVRRPYEIDDHLRRIDNTPLHKALHEALANTLVHADYYGQINTVVIRYDDRATFMNPGGLRIPVDVAVGGGISNTRNPTLMTMFNLLSIGEKAGSGFDGMRQGCNYAGLPHPKLSEAFGPDRTNLVFFLKLTSEDIDQGLSRASSHIDGKTSQDAVLAYLDEHGTARRTDVEKLLAVSAAMAKKVLAGMVKDGLVSVEGASRATRYRKRVDRD